MKGKKIRVIGIIGGAGQMGRWFERFFEREGYNVLISDRNTSLSPEKCAEQSDVIIISVPISVTEEVIRKVGPYVREDALLMDFTSLKKGPVEAMLKYSKGAVIGLHPIFGPTVKSMKKQTIVVCPARPMGYLPWVLDIFQKNQAILKIAEPEEHDRMMAIIQGILHFSSISISHTLRGLGTGIDTIEEFSSPIFRVSMDMIGRIMSHDPSLYSDIEIKNPFVPEALEAYMKNANKLLQIIKSKDSSSFNKYFSESAEYLGSFKEEAENYSNLIIDFIVGRRKRRWLL